MIVGTQTIQPDDSYYDNGKSSTSTNTIFINTINDNIGYVYTVTLLSVFKNVFVYDRGKNFQSILK